MTDAIRRTNLTRLGAILLQMAVAVTCGASFSDAGTRAQGKRLGAAYTRSSSPLAAFTGAFAVSSAWSHQSDGTANVDPDAMASSAALLTHSPGISNRHLVPSGAKESS